MRRFELPDVILKHLEVEPLPKLTFPFLNHVPQDVKNALIGNEFLKPAGNAQTFPCPNCQIARKVQYRKVRSKTTAFIRCVDCGDYMPNGEELTVYAINLLGIAQFTAKSLGHGEPKVLVSNRLWRLGVYPREQSKSLAVLLRGGTRRKEVEKLTPHLTQETGICLYLGTSERRPSWLPADRWCFVPLNRLLRLEGQNLLLDMEQLKEIFENSSLNSMPPIRCSYEDFKQQTELWNRYFKHAASMSTDDRVRWVEGIVQANWQDKQKGELAAKLHKTTYSTTANRLFPDRPSRRKTKT